MAKVVLENVYKTFPPRIGEVKNQESSSSNQPGDSIHVLRRINLTITEGEFMVLVGPSGCGKSTLLRLIAGLEVMTGGNIWIGNDLINDLPPKARDIAMVFQNYALYPHLTVYENIAFGLRRRLPINHTSTKGTVGRWGENLLMGLTQKLPKQLRYQTQTEKIVEQQVLKVAHLLQIDTMLHRLPKQLSGGQRQRVALGRAIARDPQVFLMDEPLSNLDAKLRAETRVQIVKLQRQLGTTTIYVTHDQTEAMTMGDRIAIMNMGQIQQVARPLEIYNYPKNRFVAEFIGSPPMNFISVEFYAPLLITHSNFRFTLPNEWGKALQKYSGQTVILGIRPEHLMLSAPATKNIPVKVDLVENLGNDSFLSVRVINPDLPKLDGQILQVRVPSDRLINMGDQIWLSPIVQKLHFFDPETELAIFTDNKTINF
ncbi:ABC transporter ATP-binding protein [Cylindrospermopsis raciborskii]|uniref:Sugar ABC transporter ATP-binding protein n=1 Tax=Cylindrospermopsis raciborskii CENA302 TaxID=1170768 RepID=A0A9Q5W7Y8_9CYAN|nr:ATP-binding cassette domain-containing protein [Cylindrospermopsis raciborskii]NLQ06028.1 ATP-binding cassette domain-containing protein [Cylindrospermopsis raciborskii MVCC19]OHY32342.1 sugar ABC transporter ATP-binding protein [Cylindrospermopsis raciborskii MVCC14]OPH08743.1 sugar ABC transporter ATP-binding protein [Cylindrospermopsis raciborskii CENA302]